MVQPEHAACGTQILLDGVLGDPVWVLRPRRQCPRVIGRLPGAVDRDREVKTKHFTSVRTASLIRFMLPITLFV